MVLLIDTNIILDFLLQRKAFYTEAQKIMEFCADKNTTGYVAFHSISNIWYLLRGISDTERRAYIRRVCVILRVACASHELVECAIDNTNFKDFEDCLQDKCAQAVHADYVITRNAADFVHSRVKAITPEEFFQLHH